MAPEGLAWYCLQSRPKHEHIAASHLRQVAGLEVFCPRMRFKRLTVRGQMSVTEALFPGYLFARFDFQAMHRQVRYSSAVVKILQFGSVYATVDDSVLDSLRSRAADAEILTVSPEVNAGDEVRIAEGAFRGLEVVVTQVLPARERVMVLLEFLGRTMEAEVRRPSLMPKLRHPLAV